MKAKEKRELIEKICNGVTNFEDEAFVCIYCTDKRGDHYAVGNLSKIRNAVCEILSRAEEGDENHTPTAKAIILGVYDALDSGVDFSFAEEPEEDEGHNCAECAILGVCSHEKAIEAREKLKEVMSSERKECK